MSATPRPAAAPSHPTPAPSLLPSWPQLPRPAYALAPIPSSVSRSHSSHVRPSNSPRITATSLLRSSPYPSPRPARVEVLEMYPPPTTTTTMHDAELLGTRQALYSQASLRQQPSSQSRHTHSHSHSHSSSNASANAQSSSKEAQHKVYLLNCKHCGNFLSDRGMKAVLLLKPNITLYSTDIVPSTCGPFFPNSSSFHGGMDPMEPPVERTCECLTQSLGCYGCGAQVGYNIISPCTRCTSSVMKHSRSSNGHRTVLHCGEISVRERRYIPGEPGVRAQSPLQQVQGQVQMQVRASPPRQVHADLLHEPRAERSSELFHQLHQLQHSNASRRDLNRLHFGLDEDELEAEKAEINAALYHTQHLSQQQQQQRQQYAPRMEDHHILRSASSTTTVSPPGASAGGKKTRVLKRGDTLYWSDLVPGGERAQPFDPDPILDRPCVGR